MSELINNSNYRKERLKELILKLHQGEPAQSVRQQLISTLRNIPYGEVVEVEQELMQEGLPESEVLKLCDVHGEVLEGNVDLSSAKEIPEGHPVDVFIKENRELNSVALEVSDLLEKAMTSPDEKFEGYKLEILGMYNQLMDVDKHYLRKENLVFPYLEKYEITGPPKVMWGKHDEIRDQLKACITLLKNPEFKKQDLSDALELVFFPALKGLKDMIQKEEEILFPMAMDILTTDDWWNIHKQTLDFGFALYDPETEWNPEGIMPGDEPSSVTEEGNIQFPSGSLSPKEILSIFSNVPVDMTFVDKDDKVKYFTQGKERIFPRSRSIINRDVRLCHPPGSVHIIEKILDDFKSGRASQAPFWIQLKGKFILIEYFALRDDRGHYLGTLEVSQDITEKRKLQGEKRILSYNDNQ